MLIFSLIARRCSQPRGQAPVARGGQIGAKLTKLTRNAGGRVEATATRRVRFRDAASTRHLRDSGAPPARRRRDRMATAAHHRCARDAPGRAGGRASGSARRSAWKASARSHAWSKGVPARRIRSRWALDRDMPAARAARATLPPSTRAARKMRCLAGVHCARRGGAAGAGAWSVSIRQDEPDGAAVGQGGRGRVGKVRIWVWRMGIHPVCLRASGVRLFGSAVRKVARHSRTMP